MKRIMIISDITLLLIFVFASYKVLTIEPNYEIEPLKEYYVIDDPTDTTTNTEIKLDPTGRSSLVPN